MHIPVKRLIHPEGMGMGLAINRTTIHGARGRLWAENNPDRGAAFYLTLPISQEVVP